MKSLYKLILIIAVILIISLVVITVFLKRLGAFQKIVAMIAIIILAINLVFIAIALENSKNENWPPIVASCPDYWLSDGSGNNLTCTNIRDLGTCQPQGGDRHLTMKFNSPPFTGANGTCAKYTWANNCKIAWDGINYGVNNPCT
jgi:energy-coupling factor transporter transmembrane protein EcfT